jgi:lipopolysaccharide biosynthesis glycosyltransferase
MSNIIPIVFATDENYAPYLSVTLQSVIETASAVYEYRVFVLHNGVTDASMEKVQNQVAEVKNFSVSFVDVAEYLKNTPLFTSRHISAAAYFRLFIPYIFNKYDKVLWLDCDLLVCRDVAELYNVDIEDYMVAVVNDKLTSWEWMLRESNGEYRDVFKNFDNYFNSGVMLFNTVKLRNYITVEKLMEFTASRKWLCHDQDILNVLCEEKVKYLPMKWNVYNVVTQRRSKDDGYFEAITNPYILHLIVKPWNNFLGLSSGGEEWMKVAMRTPFADTVMKNMYASGMLGLMSKQNLQSTLFQRIANKQLGRKYVVELVVKMLKSII